MPPTQDSSSGSLAGAPLWTLTAVVILVSGLLLYFVSSPLAEAFDALLPAPQEAPPAVVQEPPPPAEPVPPPPPPPREWTLEEMESGIVELAQMLGPLIEAGRAELPTYEELGAATVGDPEGAAEADVQRATARWARWGVIWKNRVDAERAKLPPPNQCTARKSIRDACVELYDLLEDIESVADADTYAEATERMEAAATRLEVYLTPPPEPEDPDGEGDAEGAGEG